MRKFRVRDGRGMSEAGRRANALIFGDGTSGQDRKSYTDTQDRESYTVPHA